MVTRHENPHQKEKMDMTHWEGKQSHVRKSTSLGTVQDYKNRQTTHRILPMHKISNWGMPTLLTNRELYPTSLKMAQHLTGMRTSPA